MNNITIPYPCAGLSELEAIALAAEIASTPPWEVERPTTTNGKSWMMRVFYRPNPSPYPPAMTTVIACQAEWHLLKRNPFDDPVRILHLLSW